MKQKAAASVRLIRITTAIYGVIVLATFLIGIFRPMALIPAAILFLGGAYCYWFWSPVAYELERDTLTVFFRAGRKEFPAVTRCTLLPRDFPIGKSLRVCGNGGVFACSGIFWNKTYGTFRAYLTRMKPDDLVFIETETRKILISPENPSAFVGTSTPSQSQTS